MSEPLKRPVSVTGLALVTLLLIFAGPAFAGSAAKPPAVEKAQPSPTLLRNAEAFAQLNSTCPVDKRKELMITDLSVVEDCWRTTWGPCAAPPTVLPATRGAWTFKALIESVAGTNNAGVLDTFVRNWLASWQFVQTVNGDVVPARPFIDNFVIQPWEVASGSKVLNMRLAPFRVLAIVNRIDLRNAPAGYGQPGTAGEGRFVFGVIDLNNPASAPEFTVIFEYGLDSEGCENTISWGLDWHALGGLKFGDRYNAALQTITDRFATIGASPRRPNGSAINQVRTDDFTLAFPWELREFRLDPRSAAVPVPLTQETVGQTPDFDHDQTPLLANYVNTDTPAILAGTHTVPLTWLGSPFLGGASPHNLDLGWDGPIPCTSITDLNARFLFSLATCSGCHGSDTATRFYHIFPRPPGVESTLSAFLTGSGPVTDVCGVTNTFDDLERRAQDLCDLITNGCTTDRALSPAFVH